MQTRVCEFCGKEFEPNSPAQKYCSAECGSQAFFKQRKDRAEKYKSVRKQIVTDRVIECDNESCKFYAKEKYANKCSILNKVYFGNCKFYKEKG